MLFVLLSYVCFVLKYTVRSGLLGERRDPAVDIGGRVMSTVAGIGRQFIDSETKSRDVKTIPLGRIYIYIYIYIYRIRIA